jgi:hypothetical protein
MAAPQNPLPFPGSPSPQVRNHPPPDLGCRDAMWPGAWGMGGERRGCLGTSLSLHQPEAWKQAQEPGSLTSLGHLQAWQERRSPANALPAILTGEFLLFTRRGDNHYSAFFLGLQARTQATSPHNKSRPKMESQSSKFISCVPSDEMTEALLCPTQASA